MPSVKEKKQDFGIARHGGLQHAEHFLGLRDSKYINPYSDVVFLSIDLEVSRQEISKPGATLIKAFGIATLDTRHLRCLKWPFLSTKLISAFQFSTSNASKDFLDCDFTDFKECVFAETVFVSQTDVPTTITEPLRIQDDTSPDPRTLRKIVIIGHSTKTDLKILQRLGINVKEVAPVLPILDTDPAARNLFGASSTPMASFKLCALLTHLKCPYQALDLYNAGNDATFTLHAMLMLVIKSSESRELDLRQKQNLEHFTGSGRNGVVWASTLET